MTRIRASIILIAFAFVALAAPLFASAGMCKMACCKHAKSAAIQAPMCPLPQQQCPSVKRDVEPASGTTATPAPAQATVHATPAVAMVLCRRPGGLVKAGLRPALHASLDQQLYLIDSVFRI